MESVAGRIGSFFRAMLALLLSMLAVPAVADDALRLNDIQIVGSHNSYKLAMAAENFTALQAADPALAASLEYSHLPLQQQLDLGIRKIELDVFYDPQGVLYPREIGADNSSSQFRVMHVQNLDNRSSCVDLLACLSLLRSWSESHPGHVPIFISFNAKDSVIERAGFVRPLPFAEDAWMGLDAEIRAVLGDRLITPADLFSEGELRWPLLKRARGRFVAILDEGGDKRAAYASRWRERAMFANLLEDQPGAAIMIVNDPIADFVRIQRLVRAGYIVRTRADADTIEARSGDTARRDRAFESGAQLISTDYYQVAAHFGTDYVVSLQPVVRCNPVLRSTNCRLEE